MERDDEGNAEVAGQGKRGCAVQGEVGVQENGVKRSQRSIEGRGDGGLPEEAAPEFTDESGGGVEEGWRGQESDGIGCIVDADEAGLEGAESVGLGVNESLAGGEELVAEDKDSRPDIDGGGLRHEREAPSCAGRVVRPDRRPRA